MAAPTSDLNTQIHWRMPVAVQFGWGVRNRTAQRLGSRPVVVMAYAQALDDPLVQAWRGELGSRLTAWVSVPDGLSTLALARQLSQEVWPQLARAQDTVLIGLGGGSVMDLAKWLRWRPLDGEFEALLAGLEMPDHDPPGQRHELWLMPTTAGTGSEVTPWATLWDTDTQPARKRSFDHPKAFADRALIDSALSLRCPRSVRRDSAIDALSHGLEAIWNHHRNAISTPLALSAVKRVLRDLPDALTSDELQPAAAISLSLAALEAGLAFSQTRTALAHALSYELTLEQGLSHGHAVAVWLPEVWRRALGHAADVDAVLADVHIHPVGDGADQLEAWLLALGIGNAQTLLNLPNVDIAARMDQALSSARGRHFVGSPLASGT